MRQFHLFDHILQEARLEARSPKLAFYILRLIECQGNYRIEKESGAGGKVLDRRRWDMPSLEDAEKRFEKIIDSKTNPGRKHPRIYERVKHEI